MRELTKTSLVGIIPSFAATKQGPSREGPFSWFQFGAYCTITFFVWMLRPSVTVNKYVPRGMSLTDNTVVP